MSNYDGSVIFNTKIDDSSLEPELNSLGAKLKRASQTMRDIMQGPIAAVQQLSAAFGKVKAAVAAIESEWAQQEQAVAILNSTLKATGASAWTSSERLQEMASELQKLTGYADDNITAMQSVLLGFKNIKGDAFDAASVQILNMARVMKMDLTSAAQAVGKALDDPINGVDSLSRQGFRFSDSQKEVLKSMVETGNIAEAQAIILGELSTTYGGAAAAANATGSAISERLQVSISELNEEMGHFITDGLAPVRVKMMEVVDGFAGWFQQLNENGNAPEILEGIAIGLTSVVAGITAFLVVAKGHAIITTLAGAMQAVNAAMAANPVGLIAAAITMVLIPAIILLVKNWDAVVDIFNVTIAGLKASFGILGSKVEEAFVVGFNGAKVAVISLAQAIANDVLKGVENLLAVMGKLPFVGKEFQAASQAVAGFRKGLDGSAEAAKAEATAAIAAAKAKQDAIEVTRRKEIAAAEATAAARRKAREEAAKEAKGLNLTPDAISQKWEGADLGSQDGSSASFGTDTGSTKKEKKDKTFEDRLRAIDSEYIAERAIAEKAGEDTAKIEEAWLERRVGILKDFMAERIEEGTSTADALAVAIGGSYGTIDAELEATITKQQDLANAALETISAIELTPEHLDHEATIAKMKSETEQQLADLYAGVARIEAEAAASGEVAAQMAEQRRQEEQAAEAENIRGLQEGAARAIAQELADQAVADQMREQALDNRAAAEAAATQEHIEGLKAGVALIAKNEKDAAAIADQVREQELQARVDAMNAETAAQIEGMKEGVALIQKREDEAKAIADQARDQEFQDRIAAMNAQNAADLKGLQEGVANLEKAEAEKAAIAAQLREQEHLERVAAMQAETVANLAGLKEGVKNLEAAEKEKAEIEAQIREQAFHDRIAAQKAQTEADIKALKEGVAAMQKIEADAKAVQQQLDDQALEEIRQRNAAETAAQVEGLQAGVKALEESAAIQEWIREQEHRAKIEAMEAETKAMIEGLQAGAELVSNSENIGTAWKKLVADIKKDAKDWSDVLGTVKDQIGGAVAGAFETLGESIVDGEQNWADWGASALQALAAVLKSIGYQLAALAVTHALMGDFVGAALAIAGSVAAFVASGVIGALAEDQQEAAAAQEEAVQVAKQYTDALEEQNKALKENMGLWTQLGRVADAYASVLTGIKKTVASFYKGLQDIGSDIAGILTDGLIEGFGEADFLYSIQEYIRKAVIQAAVFTESFMTQVAAIGAQIAQGIANGFSADQLSGLRARLAGLYESASIAAGMASDIVGQVFGSYDVGTLQVRGDQLAKIHNNEMILEPGIAQQARTKGIYIGPVPGIDSGRSAFAPTRQEINVTTTGIIQIDGREIGRVAFQYADAFQGSAYGM